MTRGCQQERRHDYGKRKSIGSNRSYEHLTDQATHLEPGWIHRLETAQVLLFPQMIIGLALLQEF